MKKGSMFDVLWILILVLVLGLILMVGDKMLGAVYTAGNSSISPEGIPAVNTTFIQSGQTALLYYDAMLPIIIAGLLAVAIVSAYYTPSHPVMIIPAIFSLLLIIIVAAQLTNAYALIATQPELVDSANKLPVTAAIMSNLPTIALFLGAVLMIAMFVYFRGRDVAG